MRHAFRHRVYQWLVDLDDLPRQPLMTQRISALIRVHGIWLWLHRLPIRSRPPHTRQEGV